MTGAVILAAGAGRRLGGAAKALLPLPDGTSFLAAIAVCARAAGVQPCVVVIGPPHDRATAAEARRLGLAVVHNPAPRRGMASSVALGFAYLAEHLATATAGLLWPVDHPRVQAGTVGAVIRACAPDSAVVPAYQGRGGHPAAFGRSLWPALRGCAAEPEGARSVLRRLAATAPERVVRLEVDDIGVVADVDTHQDR